MMCLFNKSTTTVLGGSRHALLKITQKEQNKKKNKESGPHHA